MAFWNIDLTTPDGAHSAAQLGAFACFVAAALGLLGLLFLWGSLAQASPYILGYIAGPALVELALFAIAGFRLRAGRGVIWGSVAVAVLALELVVKLAAVNILGLVINTLLLIGIVNGVRGAWALRRGVFDGEEAAAIFE